MTFDTAGLAHLGLRVTDLGRSVAFYEGVLGFQKLRELNDRAVFNAHGFLFALLAASADMPRNDRFTPFRVGLDHIALAVPDPARLAGMQAALDSAGVANHGVQQDAVTGGTPYISFYDPDGIAWEFYTTPAR
jgi:catechol 2,3-dioxygenase-like lactoylglutathione lyase family enzyme